MVKKTRTNAFQISQFPLVLHPKSTC